VYMKVSQQNDTRGREGVAKVLLDIFPKL